MKRWVVLVAGLAAFIIASKLVLEDMLGLGLEPLARRWLEGAGIGTAALIVAILAADVLLPVPSSFVMVLSGAAFGVLPGAVLALVGSVAGEWLGFELVRHKGRGMAARLVGDEAIEDLTGFFARYGAAAVVITRPLPVVMETISIIAGLSAMPRGTFLLASLAGTAPIVLLYAYAGSVSRDVGSLLPAVIMLVAIGGGGLLWFRSTQPR